jgi:putative transcriptional regulator
MIDTETFPNLDARTAEALEEIKHSLESGEELQRTKTFSRRVVDISALRKRYGMTQQQFAEAFRISLGTLRNWEQGRRAPDGPAQRLLEIIEDRPDVALEVLNRPEAALLHADSRSGRPDRPATSAQNGTVVHVETGRAQVETARSRLAGAADHCPKARASKRRK